MLWRWANSTYNKVAIRVRTHDSPGIFTLIKLSQDLFAGSCVFKKVKNDLTVRGRCLFSK